MNSWALSPWLQVPMGAVLLLAGLVGWTVLDDSQYAERLTRAGEVCRSSSQTECLRPVDGRITDQRGRASKRYRFVPADSTRDDEWVRFPGNELTRGGAVARLLRGEPATALYAGDEVVAFDLGGTRLLTLDGEPGSSRTVVWGSLFVGSVGALMLLGVWTRRTRQAGQGWEAYLSLVLLMAMLGSLGALFAGSLGAELITFAVVGGAMGALGVWGRWRQQRLGAG